MTMKRIERQTWGRLSNTLRRKVRKYCGPVPNAHRFLYTRRNDGSWIKQEPIK